MRQLYAKFILALMALLFLGFDASATHFMGIDISYQCLSGCTYRIVHKSYYDCNGAATPNPPNTPGFPAINFIGNPGGCNSIPLATGGWTLIHYIEITPICAGGVTKCTNSSAVINGVREAIYRRDYDLCSGGSVPCTSFNITWGSCCRNGVITSGAANQGIYSGNTRIDLTISPCNSSPTFLAPPVPYICAGQPFTFNQGAFDPDGDSLAYVLGPCAGSAAANVNYAAGYSPAQPLGPTWNVTMNPFTGDITMLPNPTGAMVVGVMCIVVQEWRNGVLIGSVVRDMQITVIGGCTSTNPVTGGVQNLRIGGVPADPVSPTEVLTCANTPMCFDIPVISQDTALDYTIAWNQQLASQGATFTDTNLVIMNTVPGKEPVGRFCWTPTQIGTYSFVVTTKDDACPVPGLNQYTILIYVRNVLSQSSATAVPIMNCNAVQLTALPKTQISSPYNHIYTYNWSGNGNLQPGFNANLQDSTFTHSYPAPSNYFYDLFLQDTFGCRHNFRNFLTLNQGVVADAGPDLTICSGFQFQLGAPHIPGQFYSWTPGTGLNSTSIADPFFSLANFTPGQKDTVDFTLFVTDSICSTEDYVRVIVNPSLQVSITPTNPVICRGGNVTLTASGGSTYLWSNGAITPTVTVSYTAATTLSVVGFSNGCTSLPEFVRVNIDPGPVGQIAGTFKVCSGESSLLVASGGSSYAWSTTPNNTPTVVISNITKDTTVYMIPTQNGCLGDTVFATLGTYDTPVPDFGTSPVCEGLASEFFDASTVASGQIVSWTWDFGDGGTATSRNPVHSYTSPGVYPVTLTVVTDNGCEATLTRNVTVEPVPNADFDFTNVCEGFSNVFTDKSSISGGGAIVNYAWKFGDGTSSFGTQTSHQYGNSGYFNTTLIVTSAGGCIDSFTQTVFVHPNPNAQFDVINACQDSVVFSFNGSSVGGGLDEIVDYTWDFGDPGSGGLNTSSLKNPVHIYAGAGTKTITLTVATGNGCASTTTRDVTVFQEPFANFTTSPVCENRAVQFFDASTTDPLTPLVAWDWNFGNGLTSNAFNPSTLYRDQGPGRYPITLKVTSSENCTNTQVKYITVSPAPVTAFWSTPVCINDTTKFIDESTVPFTNIVQWDWDFGGAGQGPNGLPNPHFVYDNPGTYVARLTATTDSGCYTTASRTITIWDAAPLAELVEDTVCFSNPAYLIAGAASNVNVKWYETIDATRPFHEGYTYVTPPLTSGVTYYVTTTTEHECVSERFPITGYVAQDENILISPSRTLVELPVGNVEFALATTIDILAWDWDFGDGNRSDLEQPVHEFEFPGKYEVTVTATDRNGCVHSATTLIEVKKVVNSFIPSAFSPNGDGYNDVFEIGPYNLREFTFKVFSRWGQKVFETTQPDFKWNGKDTKSIDVPEGVYVYVVKYLDVDGKFVESTGTITLLR